MNEYDSVLSTVFDRLADGVCLTSRARILYLNAAAAKYLAVAREQALGASLCALLCRHLAADGCADCAAHCVLRDPESEEKAVAFEGRYSRRAFDWHELKIDKIDSARDLRVRCLRTAARLGDDQDDVHLTLIEDASSRAAREREREDWRSMIAHDLRSPLTAIYGVFRDIQDELKREAAASPDPKLIEIGVSNCRRMIELVDLYLGVSNLDAGRMGAEPAETNLAQAVRRCVEDQSPTAGERGIEVCIAVPSELKVLADALLLSRVVQNLLNNALKFTPPGGRVDISAEPDCRDRVQLCVADTGAGIAPEELLLLFDRDHLAKARREGKIQGNGLGLAFCRQALAAMGGDIRAESTPGQGSRFLVRLPAPPRRRGHEG